MKIESKFNCGDIIYICTNGFLRIYKIHSIIIKYHIIQYEGMLDDVKYPSFNSFLIDEKIIDSDDGIFSKKEDAENYMEKVRKELLKFGIGIELDNLKKAILEKK